MYDFLKKILLSCYD